MDNNNFSQNDFNNVHESDYTELFNSYFNNFPDISSNEYFTSTSQFYSEYVPPQYIPSQPVENTSFIIYSVEILIISPQINLLKIVRIIVMPVSSQIISSFDIRQSDYFFSNINTDDWQSQF